mmetsp:Transcript_12256/g.34333  ORF Transcript_12256/g.34333 Transcript_12256/m.34333 type:complete len:157 (-) Transcript_12256:97-567(-)
MMHQKESAARTHLIKMERLFKAGDASGDGFLDIDEFMTLMQNGEVKTWLSSMGLDAGDGEVLFEFMDVDRDSKVSLAELVDGVSKLKGAARSLDLQMCLKRQEDMFQVLREIHPDIDQRWKELTRVPSFSSSTRSSAGGISMRNRAASGLAMARVA